VKRAIARSNAFIRAARRFAKKNPQAVEELLSIIAWLEEDAFQPRLKTHKLHGDLEGSWACSLGRDRRIVFEFVRHEGRETVLLQSLGRHDEVY
jgi:mRNA-degrading endonuclease YafQ of YafQ-DinJ toxin-antitoxin module